MTSVTAPGIWKFNFGSPEKLVPSFFQEIPPRLAALEALPQGQCHLLESDFSFKTGERGCQLEISLDANEELYGLGLQLKSFKQTGLKKTLRVNSDPVTDSGDSHAPVPLLVSSKGWAILADTARYMTIYMAGLSKAGDGKIEGATRRDAPLAENTQELYKQRSQSRRRILLDIHTAKGVDIIYFSGPDMKTAVQRYNLYSGGGYLPPLWGLGTCYRINSNATQEEALSMAARLRKSSMPCDVLGLEPGWQTHAYSCSYQFSKERFPEPAQMIQKLDALGFKLNLWEHIFTHPESPIYDALAPYSGDYEVWGGLVPDLAVPQARQIFAAYHKRELVDQGITGFKLDECDNSDFVASPWSFPEASHFPSGLDGEQMHSMLGSFYQRTIYSTFRDSNRRTLSQVRSSHALAAPYPFVLYSDLYDHRDFVRGMVNMGFSGLSWTPEIRDSKTCEEFIRRMQTAALSPQLMINAWYLKNPPWMQIDTEKNNRNEFMDNAGEMEVLCRDILRLRMSLIPYLYSAYARYNQEGLPPFRALVMDYPEDVMTHQIDDAYMMGDSLLIAPMFAGQTERDVYLPAGLWFDFHTHQPLAGGKIHKIKADLKTIPIFVKDGAILPLARPVECVQSDTVFELMVLAFGENPNDFTLIEDDGLTFDFEKGLQNRVTLSWNTIRGPLMTREKNGPQEKYRVIEWKRVTSPESTLLTGHDTPNFALYQEKKHA